MNISALIQHMQDAVDIVQDSPHPTNKVAATLVGTDHNGRPFALSRTNHWPEAIAEKIGTTTKIGNASGTIHAEMACILAAPKTRDCAVFVTDPPCPNCTKYMAEAGVKDIYIDHKGFHKDFAKRRGDHFENMSLRICQRAGVSVHEIFRKDRRLVPIIKIPNDYKPPLENPALLEIVEDDKDKQILNTSHFLNYIKSKKKRYKDEPFAVALVTGQSGQRFFLSAGVHHVIGYTSETTKHPDEKYSFLLQPINRLLTNAARKGLTINPDHIFSSRVPTARELVNLIGARLPHIYVSDLETSRDKWGLEALKILRNNGIIDAQATV